MNKNWIDCFKNPKFYNFLHFLITIYLNPTLTKIKDFCSKNSNCLSKTNLPTLVRTFALSTTIYESMSHRINRKRCMLLYQNTNNIDKLLKLLITTNIYFDSILYYGRRKENIRRLPNLIRFLSIYGTYTFQKACGKIWDTNVFDRIRAEK